MADHDRPENETPRPRPRKRRRPPVLDLRATEVEQVKARDQAPDRDAPEQAAPRSDEAARTAGRSAPNWRAQLRARGWTPHVGNPVVTGVLGAAGGALVVVFVMSFLAGSSRDSVREQELTVQVAALSGRIDALTRQSSAAGAVTDQLDRLTKAISESEQRLAAIEKRPPPQPADLSGVNERTAAIEATLKELRGSVADLRRLAQSAPPAASPSAVDALANRIGGLERQISALAKPDPAPDIKQLIAQLSALKELADAIESGRPFVKELEVARARLGANAVVLAPLEASASTGLPTTADLARRFDPLAPQLVREPSADQGIFARLLANATRLVEVRRVGEPEGSGTSAVVARMETSLARSDLDGALAEAEALPEAAQAAAGEWLTAARARRDAERFMQQATEAALAEAERRSP